MTRLRYIIYIALTMPYAVCAYAAETDANVTDSIGSDSIMPDSIAADSLAVGEAPRRNIVTRLIDYLSKTNDTKRDKVFDISFIAGPHYSSDTGFGIGVVAAGLYRMDRNDTIPPPSSVSLYGDATTGLFFMLGIRGANIFPQDRSRINYDITFESFDTYFWGIGYEMDKNNANKSRYKYFKTGFRADYMWRFGRNLYLGPSMSLYAVNGRRFEKPELWDGQPSHTFSLGAGVKMSYDTRDFPTNAYKGVYIALEQTFNPRFMANKYAFSSTEITACSYNRAWKDAVIATRIYGKFTWGNTPWGMLPQLGGSNYMRGYYQGRYTDKCAMEAVVEVRQHVWRRNGVVAWVGAGTVFPKFSELRWRKVLPNYGIGYRWEFKKRVNVRLDLGFGRGQTGFIFSIDEAF